jgi:hypothetical protein
LEIKSGRVYISRDVIFDETQFPFSKLHPNAGTRLRTEISLLPDTLLNPSTVGGNSTFDRSDVSSTPTNALETTDEVCMQDYPSSEAPGIFSGENRSHFMSQGDFLAPGASPDPGVD